MKSAISSKIFRSIRAFTLIEVLIGGLIIASFVSGTVFMAGQIGEARIGGLAQRDRNAWANLQTQLAAEGIDASATNSAIWAGKGFDGVDADDSLAVDSSNTPEGNAQIGEGLVVMPFRLSLRSADNPIGERSNHDTVGLMLMDHTTALGGSGLGQPTDPYAFYTEVAIAKYNEYGVLEIVKGSTVTLDALTDLNWADDGTPAFYALVYPSAGTITDASITYNEGTVDETTVSMMNESIGGWRAAPVSLASIVNDSFTIAVTATDGQNPEVNNILVNITPVEPLLVLDRVTTAGVVNSLATVTLWDVVSSLVHGQVPHNQLRIRAMAPDGVTELPDEVLSRIGMTASVDEITIYTANDMSGTGAIGVRPSLSVDYFSAETALYSVDAESDSPLINDSVSSMILSADPSYLPGITLSPSDGASFYTALNVLFAPAPEPVISTDIDPHLYQFRYTLDGTTPTESSLAVPDTWTVSDIGAGLGDGQSITLSTSAFLHAGSPEGLKWFLEPDANAGGTFVAVYQKEDDPYKTLAFVNILDNVQGHVAGSIQVNQDCQFNVNSKAEVGFALILNFEPHFVFNGDSRDNLHFYYEDETSEADILAAIETNGTECIIVRPSASTIVTSSNTIHVNDGSLPVSIKTSTPSRDPEGELYTTFDQCTGDVRWEGDVTISGTYYIDTLTLKDATVKTSGEVYLYVKNNIRFNGGSSVLGTEGDTSSLHLYVLNGFNLNSGRKINGRVYCGKFIDSNGDGDGDKYVSGKITINSGASITGKLWCHELNMNGEAELLIQ